MNIIETRLSRVCIFLITVFCLYAVSPAVLLPAVFAKLESGPFLLQREMFVERIKKLKLADSESVALVEQAFEQVNRDIERGELESALSLKIQALEMLIDTAEKTAGISKPLKRSPRVAPAESNPYSQVSDLKSPSSINGTLRAGDSVSSQSDFNRPIKDKWAVVIGIGNFQDQTIPKLAYPAKDARDFRNFLVQQAGFQSDHVRLLLDKTATKERILTEIGEIMPRLVGPDDLIVLYFSSHGSPADRDIARKNFLIAYDSKKSNLYPTSIGMQDLLSELTDRVGADRVLIVLDACHSGAADPNSKAIDFTSKLDVEQIQVGKGNIVLSSSKSSERSWESKKYPNGIFTRILIDSLTKAGTNKGILGMFEDLKDDVSDEARQEFGERQTPHLKTDGWSGKDLIVSAPATKPRVISSTVKQMMEPDCTNDSSVAKFGPSQAGPSSIATRPSTDSSGSPPQNPKPTVTMTAARAVSQGNSTTRNDKPISDKWALVVGISKFVNPQLNLRYAAKDAQDFYNYLITEGRFQKDHVLLLLNEKATRMNIMSAFTDKFLPSVTCDGDLVTMYVSTRSIPAQKDPGNRNYILAYDSEPNALYATGVDMDELCRRLKKVVRTDRALIVMDANCDAQQVAQASGHLVVASSSPNERSWDSKTASNSVFAKYLLQELRLTGGNVKNSFAKLKQQVEWEVKNTLGETQTPQLGGNWEGAELILSAPPTAPRAIINPTHLKM